MLSFAGRLTLIKSVLASLPIYYMSIFKMPKGVANKINRLQAAFLWGDSETKRKVHMVSWEVVSKPQSHGGLGVRNIAEINDFLLLKWW